MAHPGGRPPKLTEEQRAEIFEALVQYIQTTDDPTVSGFVSYNELALQYNVTHDNIYDWQEFSVLRKRAIRKQEAFLLTQGGSGKYNPTIAIFRLKQPQHGYTDKQERENTHKIVSPIMKLDEVVDALSGNDGNTQSQEA